jgi:hypothetical protein
MTTYSEQFLKAAAMKAGIHDLDALALADLSRDDGTARGADELIAALKQAKPHLFKPKKMKDMTQAEQDAWWKEHARRFPGGAPPPEPMPTDKLAKDMTPAERDAFLKECARRFG